MEEQMYSWKASGWNSSAWVRVGYLVHSSEPQTALRFPFLFGLEATFLFVSAATTAAPESRAEAA